jgi:hypothetical protein
MGWLWLLVMAYAGTSMLGTSIRLGWVSTRGWHWVHHALFALLWVCVAVASFWSYANAVPWRWGVIATAPFLAFLPRFRPGSSKHCLTAAAGLIVLVATLIWAIIT